MIVQHGVLYEEHEFLGASFVNKNGWCSVASYAGEKTDGEAFLADLTGTPYLLLSGPAAPDVAARAVGAPAPAVGRCVVLDGGEGACILARCGDTELVFLGGMGDELGTKLVQFSRSSGAELMDATSMLTPLVLAGPAAQGILGDYLKGEAKLPAPGEVAQMVLDGTIPAVAVGAAPNDFVLLVQPARARVLWRSFLSFTEVTPIAPRMF